MTPLKSIDVYWKNIEKYSKSWWPVIVHSKKRLQWNTYSETFRTISDFIPFKFCRRFPITNQNYLRKLYMHRLKTGPNVTVNIYSLNPNLGGGGFSLDKNLIKTFAAFSNISLETSVPNLVSLTHPSLQILGKTQTGVFPISRFLLNPLQKKLS